MVEKKGNLILTKEDFYKQRRKKEARRRIWLRREREKNKIYFIICIAVTLYCGISMLQTGSKINSQEERLRDIHIQIAEQMEENEIIEHTLTLPEEKLLEEYARENYDYLRPGEIKYYYINGE